MAADRELNLPRLRMRIELFVRIGLGIIGRSQKRKRDVSVFTSQRTTVVVSGKSDTIRFEQSGNGNQIRLQRSDDTESKVSGLVDQVILLFQGEAGDQRKFILPRIDDAERDPITEQLSGEFGLTSLFDAAFPAEV